MSHEVYKVNDKDSMAFTGQTPWHGLGQRLTENAPIEMWQDESGLNWQADERDIYYTDHLGDKQKVPGKKILTRSDNSEALSVVSDKYKTVQPKEIIEFFRDLVETNDFNLHTAGSLKNGRTIWALADIREGFTLANDDRVNGFLLLSTSLDQTMSTRAQFTTVRVVCNNTLSMAINRDNKSAVKVNHNTIFDPSKVKNELGIGKKLITQFSTDAKKMRETTVSKKQVVEYLTDTLCPDLKKADEQGREVPANYLKCYEKRVKTAMNIYERAPGQKEAGDTAWGMLNAVSYYTDHAVKERQVGNRLQSTWFGVNAIVKQNALQMAIEATYSLADKKEAKKKAKAKREQQSELIESIISQTKKSYFNKKAA